MPERSRRAPSQPGRVRRAPSRAGTAAIEEDQVIEVAPLAPMPSARVAIHEASTEAVAQVRAAVIAQGFAVAYAAVGLAAIGEINRRLASDAMPDVVVVGLPAGTAILDAARALEPRRPVLIAAVAGVGQAAAERAHGAGADLVAVRPHDLERLGPVLFAAAKLADERRRGVAARGNELRLRERLDRMAQVDPSTGLQPMEFFQRALELELKRARRYGYALSVCMVRLPPPAHADPTAAAELRAQAAAALSAAVRDIDLPVEIGGDRVLILLPYTDAIGAALVARRVVAAIAVVQRGKERAAAVAGVAGVLGGAALSLATLMRAAAAALREAERGPAPVVVAP
ncbi:MAG: hypothetical protein IPL61_26340 [Myxococcales bacterium]|nr:hypothetical protein [Myxococcales bacterium]